MNPVNNLGDNDIGAEGPGSVSRSGRVRKKNSLLAVYDSTDVVDKRKRRVNKLVKNSRMGNNVRGRPSHIVGKKPANNYQDYGISSDSYSYDSLDILNQTYDGEVPDFAEEEIIDQSLLDDDDLAEANNYYNNANARLKSQAESTYMLEKTYVKQKKMPGDNAGTKKKATRKDKGSPRVTAYMLWAKEQRANFTKKYPHMDFSSLSKKLSDLWATVPQNQKRMWKTKAAKIMKKNAMGANIKNSAGPNMSLARKNLTMLQQRKGMKNTTPAEVSAPKRPIGRPPKLTPTLTLVQNKPPSTSNHPAPIYHTPPGFSRKRPVAKHKKNLALAAANNVTVNPKPLIPPARTEVAQSFSPASYQFSVRSGTGTLDVAAHLSLLGESMKKLGTSLQKNQNQTNESLSSLLDSLLCAVGPLLCLSRQVAELNCIPENQLKRILGNIDYVMPGV